MKVSDGFTADLTAKIDRLGITFLKRMGGTSGGIRRSNEKGSSNEFSDFRSYSYGDSLRNVDWNSYARLDKLFIKLYTEEKQTEVNILADTSASMGFENKAYISGLLAVSLCYAALGGGDRAKLTMGGESLSLTSKREMKKLLDFADSREYGGVFEPLNELRRADIRDRGRIFIISDLMYPADIIDEAVKYAAYKKQELTLVMLTSAEEEQPQLDGSVTLNDCETDEKVNLYVDDDLITAYKAALKEHKGKISALCRRYGAEFIDITTDRSLNALLGTLLK